MHVSIREQGPPFKVGDRQPPSTELNESQRGQRDIGGVAQVREPVFIDLALVRMCKDELDAINLCIDLSHQKDEFLCRQLGIDKGHWSRIRKGMAHFPTKRRLELMRLAGNWVPLQYELDRSRILDRLKAELNRTKDDGFSDWIGRAA